MSTLCSLGPLFKVGRPPGLASTSLNAFPERFPGRCRTGFVARRTAEDLEPFRPRGHAVRAVGLERAVPPAGAPRIHGELLKLGFSISQAAVSKYMVRYPSPPSQSWRTFLTNHADCLASIDFFVVPTATFHLLFGFIVLHHERRQIVHFGVTANPTMAWVAQQIQEAFPWGTAPRYLIRDRDGAYGQSFRSTVTAKGVEEVVTAPRSPWQNPYVERLIGSVRRECLGPFDHPQRAAFAAHSWLIPRLLSRFKDPLVARQGHTGWTTRSAGPVWNGRFLAQGRRSASSLRTPRGLTTPARIDQFLSVAT